MGLDMFLDRVIYVGGQYDFNKVTGEINLSLHGKELKLPAKEIAYIACPAIRWRKAYAIHQWFIENVMEYAEPLVSYPVEIDTLLRLRDELMEALENRECDASVAEYSFPCEEGDYDEKYGEDYWNDLEDALVQVSKVISEHGASPFETTYEYSYSG